MKDIHDIIKHAKFGDDRLRGLGVVVGQISAFPIDFAGRPYNTLTLPCERVMSFTVALIVSSSVQPLPRTVDAGSPGHSTYCYAELAASFINFIHYCSPPCDAGKK